jgi:polar amino acid transport system permease protein
MRRLQAFRHVILPQALLKILGPLGNQLIILVKDTSLVSAIGVMELTMTGKMAIERSAASVEIFVAIALFYLLLTSVLGSAFRIVEHRTAGRH